MLLPGVDPARGIFGPPKKKHQPAGAASDSTHPVPLGDSAGCHDGGEVSPKPVGMPSVPSTGAQSKSSSTLALGLSGTGCQSKSGSSIASPPCAGPGKGRQDAVAKTPQPVLAARRDAPRVQHSTKGNLEAALAAVATEEARAEADAAYRRDMYSTTGPSVRNAAWSTWCKLHVKRFGEALPFVPLTVTIVAGILAGFKAGRYRSVANYASVARSVHIRAGYTFTDALRWEFTAGIRSALRGIGPSHQCAEFPLDRLGECTFQELPEAAGEPIGFLDMFVFATFFLLREVEVSLMLATSITFDNVLRTVTVWLPSSKTDPRAVSCKRRWGCVCEEGREQLLCAYHAALRQARRLVNKWPDGLPAGLPFFPTREGMTVTKNMIVTLVFRAAVQLGLRTTAEDGRDAWTGHVFRITGARHLARNGVDHALIMLLARWASAVILGYLKEAPLEILTDKYKKNVHNEVAGASSSSAASRSPVA